MWKMIGIMSLVSSTFLGVAAQAQSTSDKDVLGWALAGICSSAGRAPLQGARRLDGQELETRPMARASVKVSEWRARTGQKIRVSEVNQKGRRLVFVDIYGNLKGEERPLLRGVARGNCQVIGGREIVYETTPNRVIAEHVRRLGPDLSVNDQRIPLNPPPPKGTPRDCVRVGLLDNGVNYTRQDIASRLAYGRNGQLIGLDVWENDGRPFDYGYPVNSVDPRTSIFNPRRHGSLVASVILNYAPRSACIVPVRYLPISAGREISKVANFFSSAGVKVVSIQSGRGQEWPDFRRAITAHPEILFIVAAGNEGSDLNLSPRYPASYSAPNLLVVAGTDIGERNLWKRSNYGAGIVEVAVSAENVSLKRFDGAPASLSGTSFASPKVAGYASAILTQQPYLSGAELKNRILSDARGTGRSVRGMPVLTERVLKPL